MTISEQLEKEFTKRTAEDRVWYVGPQMLEFLLTISDVKNVEDPTEGDKLLIQFIANIYILWLNTDFRLRKSKIINNAYKKSINSTGPNRSVDILLTRSFNSIKRFMWREGDSNLRVLIAQAVEESEFKYFKDTHSNVSIDILKQIFPGLKEFIGIDES